MPPTASRRVDWRPSVCECFEPAQQEVSAALRQVERIEAVLERWAVSCPRLLHGTDATAWPLLDEAARRGYDARIGLEDTLTLPDGSLAAGNGTLVAAARRRLARMV
ncbi:MAG TPA: 3-keto-5-aminohexanoate cleavage protein [Gemmatimonadales bacterium]|nr:3-keto-5-aminohexanoate cleavage protein [Gemmatimonadales bacterium]